MYKGKKPQVACKTHGEISWEDAAFRVGMRSDRLVRLMSMIPTAPDPILLNEIRLIRTILADVEKALESNETFP